MSHIPIKTTHVLFITLFSYFNEIILDVITDCGDTKLQDSTTSPSNTLIKTESSTTNTRHEFSTSQPGLQSNINHTTRCVTGLLAVIQFTIYFNIAGISEIIFPPGLATMSGRKKLKPQIGTQRKLNHA